jgi:predicted transcriptional regulator
MGELKNRQSKTFVIDKKILAKFQALAKSTRIPQSRLMDEAIDDLLRKYGAGEKG